MRFILENIRPSASIISESTIMYLIIIKKTHCYFFQQQVSLISSCRGLLVVLTVAVLENHPPIRLNHFHQCSFLVNHNNSHCLFITLIYVNSNGILQKPTCIYKWSKDSNYLLWFPLFLPEISFLEVIPLIL